MSFRDLCYKCNGRRTAAGVVSRGVPDPRRHDQNAPESDSSAALDDLEEQAEEEYESMRPLLRSNRSKRAGRKRADPFAKGQGKGKYP